MDANIIDEFLDALLNPIEAADSRTAALLQLLQESGTVSEERLNRALEQAGNAAEIKSHGRRLRLKRIVSSAITDIEKANQPKENAKTEKSEAKDEAEKPEGPKEKSGEEPHSEPNDEQHPKETSESNRETEEDKKKSEDKAADKPAGSSASKEEPLKEAAA